MLSPRPRRRATAAKHGTRTSDSPSCPSSLPQASPTRARRLAERLPGHSLLRASSCTRQRQTMSHRRGWPRGCLWERCQSQAGTRCRRLRRCAGPSTSGRRGNKVRRGLIHRSQGCQVGRALDFCARAMFGALQPLGSVHESVNFGAVCVCVRVSGEIRSSPSRIAKWSEAVVAAATMDEAKLASHRSRMVEWARERFRWGGGLVFVRQTCVMSSACPRLQMRHSRKSDPPSARTAQVGEGGGRNRRDGSEGHHVRHQRYVRRAYMAGVLHISPHTPPTAPSRMAL